MCDLVQMSTQIASGERLEHWTAMTTSFLNLISGVLFSTAFSLPLLSVSKNREVMSVSIFDSTYQRQEWAQIWEKASPFLFYA